MSEFCVKCFKKMNAGVKSVIHENPWEYKLESGLCEGCGKYCDDIVVDPYPSLLTQILQKRKFMNQKTQSKI